MEKAHASCGSRYVCTWPTGPGIDDQLQGICAAMERAAFPANPESAGSRLLPDASHGGQHTAPMKTCLAFAGCHSDQLLCAVWFMSRAASIWGAMSRGPETAGFGRMYLFVTCTQFMQQMVTVAWAAALTGVLITTAFQDCTDVLEHANDQKQL